MKGRCQSRRAFTLLELLIALAMMSALFVALNQFVFSMGELWGRGAQRRIFERHASAVGHHLQTMLQTATSRVADGTPVAVTDAVFVTNGELLTMELPWGDRVIPWVGRPLPDVVCGLQVQPDRGLLLHWVSRFERAFQNKTARTVILTPYGQRIDYEYYDADSGTWKSFTSPQRSVEGLWATPSRLRIHFVQGDVKTSRTVIVPARTGALPAF